MPVGARAFDVLACLHANADRVVPKADLLDAIRCLRRAMRLSPLHPQIGMITSGIGNALIQMGRVEEAAAAHEQSLTEYPEFATSMMGLMAAYWRLGRMEDCARIAGPYRAKAPDFPVSDFRKHRPQDATSCSDAVIGALRAKGFRE
ncbi:MAG: Tetratricopeptide repeat [Rhodobacteraceae bacterium HLUCCO18]|nr:MAG: Tetratricopeptide repeat [Rhodobacteraceae bacterium HLUCCO18]